MPHLPVDGKRKGKRMRKEYIEAGKIVTTHGVKGEVKLYPWCDDPEMFLDIETIYLDAKGQKPMTLEGVRFAKEMPLLKLEGIHSIDDAAKLRDKIISTATTSRWRRANISSRI